MPEPEEEKNPADFLIKIPFDQTLAAVHQIHAMNTLIIQNQAEILSKLTGRNIDDIKDVYMERYNKIFKDMIERLPKTV